MVSIHSSKENNFLADLSGGSPAQFWTGGLRKLSWTDGSAWDYDNWAGGGPDSQQGHCVEYSVQTREWTVQSCGEKMNFVCKKVCPMGWTLYQESCYKYIDQPRSWERARAQCLSYQADLTSVHSLGENIFIGKLGNWSI